MRLSKPKQPINAASAAHNASDIDDLERRKADHIRINMEEDVSFNQLTTKLEEFSFVHQAIPELDFSKIDTTTQLFGKSLKSPLFISSMTGGTPEAYEINMSLAAAAQELGIAMGLGSARAAIKDPRLAYTYSVRNVAPDILLFANLGAVQLNYGYGIEECQQAVDICQADALILHFNALQEVVQAEGDSNFEGLLSKVEEVCRKMRVPIIAKEVGWGFSENDARQLADAGISAIDVAGAGGTSWSQVEMYRAPTPRHARVAGAFIDWGIPTAYSIQFCHQAAPDIPILGSGGIRNGIEVAKTISLGATVAGFAGDFLRAAMNGGTEAVVEAAEIIGDELRITMFCVGAGDLEALANTPLKHSIN